MKIFAEAITDPDEYRHFTSSLSAPVLANMTEFGMSPLMSVDQLASVGVQLVLYPLSAFRAMNAAAMATYQGIRQQGSQADLLSTMQTREELYELLDYHAYEQQIDALLEQSR